MDRTLLQELYRLALMIAIGAGYAVIYDIFRIARRVIHHSVIMVSVEDLIYWIICGISAFYFFLYYNNGIFRLYMVVGIVIGIALYRSTLSRVIVPTLSLILRKFGEILTKLLKNTVNIIKIKVIAKRRRHIIGRGENIEGKPKKQQ